MKEVIFLFVVLNGGEPVEYETPFSDMDTCMEVAFTMQEAWQHGNGTTDHFAGLCLSESNAKVFRDSRELPGIMMREHSS